MMVFQQAVFVVNVLLMLVFGIDWLVIGSPKARPKTKARMGELLGCLFLSFLVLLLLLAGLGAALRRNPLYLVLSIYVLIPFAIGRFASYRTLKFYAALQMLALLASAATLYAI